MHVDVRVYRTLDTGCRVVAVLVLAQRTPRARSASLTVEARVARAVCHGYGPDIRLVTVGRARGARCPRWTTFPTQEVDALHDGVGDSGGCVCTEKFVEHDNTSNVCVQERFPKMTSAL